MLIQAPDGSKVKTYDRERTLAGYAQIDADLDCRCGNCRNHRSAFDQSLMDAGLLAACHVLGIDPNKSLEMCPFTFDDETSLVLYNGHFPFLEPWSTSAWARATQHGTSWTSRSVGTHHTGRRRVELLD